MTNLGFHRLMAGRGVRVVTTDVGDRYVLEALRREGGRLGGEQSGHLIVLDGHVTGDGLAAALLLCRALGGPLARGGGRGHAPLPAGQGERARRATEVPPSVSAEVERLNTSSGPRARARASVRHRAARPGARRGESTPRRRQSSVRARESRPAGGRSPVKPCGKAAAITEPDSRVRGERRPGCAESSDTSARGSASPCSARTRAPGVPRLRLGRDRAPRERRARLLRAVGNLQELKRAAGDNGSPATTGLGHTRWATHGGVTEENAHPLAAEDAEKLAIVLNGIVENYRELRRGSASAGHMFTLRDRRRDRHPPDRGALRRGPASRRSARAYGELEGHFAFVAIHRDHPGLLVGARHECPLVVGLGEARRISPRTLAAFLRETRGCSLSSDGDIVDGHARGLDVLPRRGRLA